MFRFPCADIKIMDFVGTASGMLNLKMHVLVVDDYSVIRKIICNSLKKIGFENIHAAENGTEALTILQDIDIGLVITDWTMPHMSGLELLQEIRNAPRTQDIPVIILTGECQAENIVAAVKSHVDNYVVKPFTAEVLKEKISSVFMKRGSKSQ